MANSIAYARLLGAFDLEGPGGTSLVPDGRKDCGLLAYLLYNRGQRIPRTQLMDLCWSDRGREQKQRSLRQSLSKLKKRFGELSDQIIEVDRHNVAVHDSVRVDLLDDEAVLILPKTTTFLDGLRPVDPVFDKWFAEKQVQITSRIVAEAQKRMHTEGATDGDMALRYAEFILRLEPTNESAARTAMKVHGKNERLLDVKRVYDACCDALRAENIAPREATRQLFQSLQSPAASTSNQGDSGKDGLPLIAVLPMKVISDDDAHGHLSHGIADEFVSRMTTMPVLRVLSLNSSQHLDEGGADFLARASGMNVAYVLSGSITPDGTDFLCKFKLSNVNQGLQVWTSDERVPQDALAANITDRTAGIIARLLPEVERLEVRRALQREPNSYRAYDHYLRARHLFFAADAKDYMASVQRHMEMAHELDPEFEPAYDQLIQSYNTGMYMTRLGVDLTKPRARALELAQKHLSLNSRNPNAHINMSWCLIWQRNFDLANRHVDEAIRLQPYDPNRLNAIGTALVFLGRLDEGEQFYRLCEQRTVHHLDYLHTDYGELCYLRDDYERALAWLNLGEKRNRFRTLFWRAPTLAQLGKLDEARADVAALVKEIQGRWHGPKPFRAADGLRWVIQLKMMRRDIDRDNLLDGLAKAGIVL